MEEKLKKLSPNAKRYIPTAQVSFHTDSKCYRVRGIAKGYGAEPDPTDTLVSIVTNKTMDSTAGTMSVTLAGPDWFMPDGTPILKPNDLMVVYMGYQAEADIVSWVDGTKYTDSEDLDTVMIGLVDTVTRTRNGGGTGSSPSIQTVVTGRDFGKILIKAMLKFYPQLGTADAGGEKFFLTTTGWLTLMKTFTNDEVIKGSPAKILDTIIRYILKPLVSTEWFVYDDSTLPSASIPGYKPAGLSNILRYSLAKTNFFIPFLTTAQQYEGSIWNLMNRVNIKPFTELFIDTRDKWELENSSGIPQVVNETVEEASSADKQTNPGEPGSWGPTVAFGMKDQAQVLLAYRNTPFDAAAWNKLRSHTLEYIDVIQESLSYTDNENYNLFWAGSTLTPFTGFDLKAVNPPLINQDNITRYGLNPLEVSIEGLELDPTQADAQIIALEGLSADLNAKLKAWFEHNVDYLSGNITIRGKGSVKIGQRLNYKSIGREFYIEGVNQNFQVYGEWHTQLTLTRGQSTNMLPVIAAKVETPAPATTQTEEQVSSKYYTVVSGDTLWGIAKSYYGNGAQWDTIWQANKDTLIARDSRNANDPGHWIYPGMSLIIP